MTGEFGVDVFLAGGIGALLAGISKGGFGSGAAFAGVAILALYVPPALALGIMLPLLLAIDVTTLKPYWKRWSWPEARLLLAGGLPGILAGAVFFQVAEPDHLRLMIGALALGFVAWQCATRRQRRTSLPVPQKISSRGRVAGLLCGGLSGFTSFISHAGGPVAAIYLLAGRMEKTRYQATTVLVFSGFNLLKLALYASLGALSAKTLLLDIYLLPFALLGAWLGVRAHRLVPEPVFFAITYVLLAVSGIKLIADGLL